MRGGVAAGTARRISGRHRPGRLSARIPHGATPREGGRRGGARASCGLPCPSIAGRGDKEKHRRGIRRCRKRASCSRGKLREYSERPASSPTPSATAKPALPAAMRVRRSYASSLRDVALSRCGNGAGDDGGLPRRPSRAIAPRRSSRSSGRGLLPRRHPQGLAKSSSGGASSATSSSVRLGQRQRMATEIPGRRANAEFGERSPTPRSDRPPAPITARSSGRR